MLLDQRAMELRNRELLQRQNGNQDQQPHDQEGLNEVRSDHGAHPAVEGVDRRDTDHDDHPEAVIETRERLQQDPGSHRLGHQEAQGVDRGDHHEDPPGRTAIAEANEVTAGAPLGHQGFDSQGQWREQDQAQTGQGVTEHPPETVPVTKLRRQQGGVAGHPGRHQGGGAQG